jgi:hypothetical protein
VIIQLTPEDWAKAMDAAVFAERTMREQGRQHRGDRETPVHEQAAAYAGEIAVGRWCGLEWKYDKPDTTAKLRANRAKPDIGPFEVKTTTYWDTKMAIFPGMDVTRAYVNVHMHPVSLKANLRGWCWGWEVYAVKDIRWPKANPGGRVAANKFYFTAGAKDLHPIDELMALYRKQGSKLACRPPPGFIDEHLRRVRLLEEENERGRLISKTEWLQMQKTNGAQDA